MSAMGGGAANIGAFAAALDAATRRLDALADAAERATAARPGGSAGGGGQGGGGGGAALGMSRAGAVGAAMWASKSLLDPAVQAGVKTGDYGAMADALEIAMMRVLQHIPGIGAIFGQALQAREMTRDKMMEVIGPLSEAGGRVTPELMESLFGIEAPRVKRLQQAQIGLDAFLNAGQQQEFLERGTGIDAWKWGIGEAGKTIKGWLDGLGFGDDK